MIYSKLYVMQKNKKSIETLDTFFILIYNTFRVFRGVIMEENNNKEKFVPAYNRENDGKNTGKSTHNISYGNKKEKKIKSKISIILMVLVGAVVIFAIIFGIWSFIVNNTGSNVDYLEDMKTYGFDIMYDNKTAQPEETVTKSEAIKMVVVSMLNESDITKIVEPSEYIADYNDTMTEEQIEEKLSYKNELWVNYAISSGIIQKGMITKENANEAATYLDALVYFANAKVKILNKLLDVKNTPNINNYDMYSLSEQLALSDMVYNGIIDEEVSGLKDILIKDKLNKLVIDMVLEYNTITVGDEKININKAKEPSNVEEYPYTLASIDKSVYELKNYVVNDTYKNARESYAETKKYYNAINSLIQDYMNIILNVDYTNFDENKFTNEILDLSFHYEKLSNIKDYVEYVKTNKIQISGSAKVQYPAIYYDGESYRVRVKVDYKIVNADKKENLIFGDLRLKESVSYDKNEGSMIVDLSIKKSVVSEIMYIIPTPLNNIKAGSVKSDKESLKLENNTQNNVTGEENKGEIVPDSEDLEYTESEVIQEGDTIIINPL